jgi:hypothetical protein
VSWIVDLAIYGAASGTIGSVTAIRNRMDAMWARRARALTMRSNLDTLRDALAEAKAQPERAGLVTSSLSFKGHVQALDEGKAGCPDRQLRRMLADVTNRCLNAANVAPDLPESPITYALTNAIDQALIAVTRALDRLDRIERSAPG